MKTRHKKILQPRNILILLLSFILVLLIDFLVDDWQLKSIVFFLVFLLDNTLLYRFTDYFSEIGIFIVPFYDFIISLFLCVLVGLAVYYTHAVRPTLHASMLLVIIHSSWK